MLILTVLHTSMNIFRFMTPEHNECLKFNDVTLPIISNCSFVGAVKIRYTDPLGGAGGGVDPIPE